MKTSTVQLAHVGNFAQIEGRRLRRDGEASLLVPSATSASALPVCGIEEPQLPSNRTVVPWVFDVFASHQGTRAYFIAEQTTKCYPDHRAEEHGFEEQVFLCQFSDPLRTKVASARVRPVVLVSSTFIIWCPIPPHVRPLVNNRDNRAQVTVDLISLKALSPLGDVHYVTAGLCANPVVNGGQIIQRLSGEMVAPPSPTHQVVGTVWVTGDSFQGACTSRCTICRCPS
jgi:hypothetical protein